MEQNTLAQDISDKIVFSFYDFFLVKPLDPIKVKKEFSKPVAKDDAKSTNPTDIIDYDKVETEIKEVDSDYRKAVVIKTPTCLSKSDNNSYNMYSDIVPGDIVLFRDRLGSPFDLLKDSKLIRAYDIIAIERGNN